MNQAKKKNFKIEPFKHKVEMDPKYAEKTWKILEDAIHEIYNHNASGLSFEELYRWELFFVWTGTLESLHINLSEELQNLSALSILAWIFVCTDYPWFVGCGTLRWSFVSTLIWWWSMKLIVYIRYFTWLI